MACGPELFSCIEDSNCGGIEGGRCEADGYCSGLAPHCASGREYGPHSGNLSGRCVAEDLPSATEDSDSQTSPVVTTGATGSTTASLPTEAGEDSTTAPETSTVPLTTGPDASSGGATSTEGSESGVVVANPCGEGSTVLLHSFGDGGLEPRQWSDGNLGSGAADIIDGALTLSMEAPGMGQHYWWTRSTFKLPSSGAVAQELVLTPPPDSGASVWLAVLSGPMEAYITVGDGELQTSVRFGNDPFIQRSQIPHDADAHRWVRLVYDASSATVVAEASPDAADWEMIDSIDAPDMDFSTLEVSPGGGLEPPASFSGIFAALATIAICEP